MGSVFNTCVKREPTEDRGASSEEEQRLIFHHWSLECDQYSLLHLQQSICALPDHLLKKSALQRYPVATNYRLGYRYPCIGGQIVVIDQWETLSNETDATGWTLEQHLSVTNATEGLEMAVDKTCSRQLMMAAMT